VLAQAPAPDTPTQLVHAARAKAREAQAAVVAQKKVFDQATATAKAATAASGVASKLASDAVAASSAANTAKSSATTASTSAEASHKSWHDGDFKKAADVYRPKAAKLESWKSKVKKDADGLGMVASKFPPSVRAEISKKIADHKAKVEALIAAHDASKVTYDAAHSKLVTLRDTAASKAKSLDAATKDAASKKATSEDFTAKAAASALTAERENKKAADAKAQLATLRKVRNDAVRALGVALDNRVTAHSSSLDIIKTKENAAQKAFDAATEKLVKLKAQESKHKSQLANRRAARKRVNDKLAKARSDKTSADATEANKKSEFDTATSRHKDAKQALEKFKKKHPKTVAGAAAPAKKKKKKSL